MENNFRGTTGEVKAIKFELAYWSRCSVGVDNRTICSMYYEGVDIDKETLENQKLITDAFNIRQQINCDLPELLEQRNKAVELLEKSINDVTFLEEAKQFLKTL